MVDWKVDEDVALGVVNGVAGYRTEVDSFLVALGTPLRHVPTEVATHTTVEVPREGVVDVLFVEVDVVISMVRVTAGLRVDRHHVPAVVYKDEGELPEFTATLGALPVSVDEVTGLLLTHHPVTTSVLAVHGQRVEGSDHAIWSAEIHVVHREVYPGILVVVPEARCLGGDLFGDIIRIKRADLAGLPPRHFH